MFKCFQTGNMLRFNQSLKKKKPQRSIILNDVQNEYLTSAQREYIMDFTKPKSDTRCIVYYKGTQNKYGSAPKVYEWQKAALQA